MQRKPPRRADVPGADTAAEPLVPGAVRIPDLDAAWSTPASGARLRAVQVAAEGLRHRFAAGPRAVAVRTIPLALLPYPTKHAFFGAALSVAPSVLLAHRCVVVQFLQGGAMKTLLFDPTDTGSARTTPFFARLTARIGSLVTHEEEPLVAQLRRLGIDAGDVDYLAFDNLHAQDLRPLLGAGELPARFPNATLLVPKIEWDEWDDLHPLQRAWFVRDGRHGLAQSGARGARVAVTSGDLMLGDGVMLLRTPGLTSGNQTLFVNTSSGIWGASANGSAADSWSPLESKIPGLRAACLKLDIDLLINSRAPERATDQYTSMVLEKALAGRLKRAPAFAQMFPNREVTPSLLSPGLKPTVLQRALTHGDLVLASDRRVRERTENRANPSGSAPAGEPAPSDGSGSGSGSVDERRGAPAAVTR